MMARGRYVFATYHCHQERQDPYVTGGWFAPSASERRFAKKPSPSSANSTPRDASRRGPWPTPSSESNANRGCSKTIGPPSRSPSCRINLQLERGRRFGDVWLAWRFWQALGLDTLLANVSPEGHEDVPWARIAAVLVIARLCEPSSELHLAEDWFRRTALGDLLDIPEAKINDDRLYRALDHLLPHQAQLETHIKERLGTLFRLEYDLLLYDVTSTYFEGQAAATRRPRGAIRAITGPTVNKSASALVVSRDGYPLGYEVFAGNRSDTTTLHELVERMEKRYGRRGRIWALDRGMVDAPISLGSRSEARTTSSARPRGT